MFMENKIENETLNYCNKFYILIPVYRVEKYIRKCIESVLNQTYQNFEIIIVDDGSPDQSGKICDEMADSDERITVIHQENMGLIAARQTAIKHLKQEIKECEDNSYIVYLDSDDSLKLNALDKINECFMRYGCDMVVYGYDRVAEGKIVESYHAEKNGDELLKDKRLIYKKVFGNSRYNSLCCKAYSVRLLPEQGYDEYYNIRHAEDLLQSIDYYKKADSIFFINESLYNYTVNPDSITQTVSVTNFSVNFTVRQKVMEFLASENVYNKEDWKEYRTYCIYILCSTLITILRFKTSWKSKVEWFNEIWNSIYFKEYIQDCQYNAKTLGWKKYLYGMFSKRIGWPILILGGAFSNIFGYIKKVVTD